jgi:CRISPR-associated protein Cas2
MMVLITYDVNVTSTGGKKRLYKVAKQCKDYGQRVQNSVFECILDPAQFTQLRIKLEKIIDTDVDSLRYYFLGDEWRTRVIHVGAKPSIDLEGTLIV